jgi:hypothetical protein
MDERSQEQAGPVDPAELAMPLDDDRVARNEVTARRINESIEDGRVNRDGLTGFVCECGQLGCNAIVELALGEYEHVRSRPRQFLVVDGHEAAFDIIVARRDRYALVVKEGFAGRIAETTDPRGEDG